MISDLNEWKLIMLSGGLGLLACAWLQIWSGKTITSLGRIVNREEDVDRFRRTVAVTTLGGIVALGLLLLVILVPPLG
jgi:hypothetical protein